MPKFHILNEFVCSKTGKRFKPGMKPYETEDHPEKLIAAGCVRLHDPKRDKLPPEGDNEGAEDQSDGDDSAAGEEEETQEGAAEGKAAQGKRNKPGR